LRGALAGDAHLERDVGRAAQLEEGGVAEIEVVGQEPSVAEQHEAVGEFGAVLGVFVGARGEAVHRGEPGPDQ
jgi:hypothetical protein